jgi:hypothetical protein
MPDAWSEVGYTPLAVKSPRARSAAVFGSSLLTAVLPAGPVAAPAPVLRASTEPLSETTAITPSRPIDATL